MIEKGPSVSYSRQIEVVRTEEFEAWLAKLKDLSGKGRIIRRLDRLGQGNAGDVRPIGRGLSELRIHVGPGYRVYFMQDGDTLILLLCGGDKSTQRRDTTRARKLAQEWLADRKKSAKEEKR